MRGREPVPRLPALAHTRDLGPSRFLQVLQHGTHCLDKGDGESMQAFIEMASGLFEGG